MDPPSTKCPATTSPIKYNANRERVEEEYVEEDMAEDDSSSISSENLLENNSDASTVAWETPPASPVEENEVNLICDSCHGDYPDDEYQEDGLCQGCREQAFLNA